MAALRVVAPDSGRSPIDWVWPRKHKRWWFHKDIPGPNNSRDLTDSMRKYLGAVYNPDTQQGRVVDPEALVADVTEATRAATERTEASERRAGTLAGAVAIASSLTISGAGLALDTGKIHEHQWRIVFLALFALVAGFFVLAGLYATRTIVGWRTWSWLSPARTLDRADEAEDEQRMMRAAELLATFAFNWEVADVKLRALDSAFRCLVAALLMVVLLAGAFVVYEADRGLLPSF
jgi:hypothetical protein